MTKQPTAAENKRAELRSAALDYHEFPTPGKVAVSATKQLTNQRDLALAYSPGVAAPCEEIVADPANAFRYTSRVCLNQPSPPAWWAKISAFAGCSKPRFM